LVRSLRGNGVNTAFRGRTVSQFNLYQLAGFGLVGMVLCAAVGGWTGLIVGIACATLFLLSVFQLVRDSRRRAASRQ
jgi:hypothetical protein